MSSPDKKLSRGRTAPPARSKLRSCLPVFLSSLALVSLAREARAQLFSPGPLAKEHRELEGVQSCTRCHSSGATGTDARIDAQKCMGCHTPIKRSINARSGQHGRLTPDDREHCERCHADHRGVQFKMIKWPGGAQKQFPHERTGFPLRGAHLKTECEACHTRKLIQDDHVLAYFAKYPGKQTFLGLDDKCASCHRDAHDKSLGAACEKCHNEVHFVPAPYFNHDATRYPLLGKHRQVRCDECHPPGEALPGEARYKERRFSPLRFGECSECHDDPHAGQLGPYCSECHTEKGWLIRKAPSKVLEDHDKSRFPLKGLHRSVDCKLCHPIVRGKQQLTGLKFERCGDCHPDGHHGQMGARTPPCDSCHNNFGFSTVAFGPERHQKTDYPLKGAHAGVPCMDCHRPTQGLRRLVDQLRRKGGRVHGVRRSLVSDARFEWDPQTLRRCTTCHKDVHAGQFDDRVAREDCLACHVEQSFHVLRFDHDRDSRFPLRGAHKQTDCGLCHVPEGRRKGGVVRYKPMDLSCVSCHPDEHYGQFASKGVDCNGCHDEVRWKPAPLFNHNAPAVRFPLDGKHAQVACERCHLTVRLTGQARTRLYQPLPSLCESCHEDHHRGSYDAFVPANIRAAAVRELLPGQPVPKAVPCAYCHNTTSWQKVSFDHDATGFPLTGAHGRTGCNDCHVGGLARKLSQRCESCHKDVHAGVLGIRCERCHNTERWIESRDFDAHRTTNFRLVGGHAAVKCEECHKNVRDRTFRRVPSQCDSCHARDVDRTAMKSLDHRTAGLDRTCERCHTPLRWQAAFYPDHDRCFPITRGNHAGIQCLRCHKSLTGAQVTPTCSTGTVTCTSAGCHPCTIVDATHARAMVEGYQCRERKCYECHPNGRK